MSEFNIPASREQATPPRIVPVDAVKNGIAYLLADLAYSASSRARNSSSALLGVWALRPFGLLDFSLETSRPYSTPALSMLSRSRSC